MASSVLEPMRYPTIQILQERFGISWGTAGRIIREHSAAARKQHRLMKLIAALLPLMPWTATVAADWLGLHGSAKTVFLLASLMGFLLTLLLYIYLPRLLAAESIIAEAHREQLRRQRLYGATHVIA